jgi:hypothetical protein
MTSSARTRAEWSLAPPPWATQTLKSSRVVAVFGKETPSERALDSARLRSFWWSRDRETRIERPLDHALSMQFENARGRESPH